MRIDEIFSYLYLVIKKGHTHQDYQHTINLKKEYTAHLTGNELDEFYRQFNRRETDEAFAQRVEISEAISKPTLEKTLKKFNKIYRADNIRKGLIFKGESEGEANKAKLDTALESFYKPKSLESYLNERYGYLNFSDPNTFIVVDFDDFDANLEVAKPRPVEFYSDQVLDFKYEQQDLEYLTCQKNFVLTEYSNGTPKSYDTKEYFLYLKEHAIRLTPIKKVAENEETKLIEEDGTPVFFEVTPETIKLNGFEYAVSVAEPKAGDIQAVRVGYLADKSTNGRTMVSPYDSAMPYFRKMLKTVSEFDLTMALHAFPQKFSLLPRCNGTKEAKCKDGYDTNGKTCKACNGLGIAPIHTSAQDDVYFPMPREISEAPDLEKLAVYKSPPIDIVKFQNEQIDNLLEKIDATIFNTENFLNDKVAKTATEVTVSYESIYDTLFEFAEGYSHVYSFITHRVANIVDITTLEVVEYEFPRNFRFETTRELISQFGEAEEANAPAFVKRRLESDLAKKVYAESKIDLVLFQLQQAYDPLAGESNDHVQFAQANRLVTERDIFIHYNIKKIFELVKQKHIADIFKKHEIILPLIDAITDEHFKSFQESKEVKLPGFTGEDDDEGLE